MREHEVVAIGRSERISLYLLNVVLMSGMLSGCSQIFLYRSVECFCPSHCAEVFDILSHTGAFSHATKCRIPAHGF